MRDRDDTLTWTDRMGLRATDLSLRGLIGAVTALPYPQRVAAMGWLTSHVISPLAGYDARIRNNLAYTLPEMTKADQHRLCRAVADNVGRSLIEIYSAKPFLTRARAAPVTGPGLAALEEARADGRPVVLVTAHFGNYDAARANLFGRGHVIGALYRRMSNPYFNAHYVAAIGRVGQPVFEQGRRGILALVQHLKAGGIIAIVTDVYVHGGAMIPFFGKPAPTSLVAADLALKHDALLLPVYGLRQPDGLNFEILMPAPIAPSDPLTMTTQVTAGLEDLVRQHMAQWFWIHRRWKPWLHGDAANPGAPTP